jgi:hypothetical protein
MILSGKKRKENKEIKVYLNYKPFEQVIRLKYLGIIIDDRFRFSEHTSNTAARSVQLIHSLSK